MLRVKSIATLLTIALLICLINLIVAHSQSVSLRRITNVSEERTSLNPSLSGDGRHIAFETTGDVIGPGGSIRFRAFNVDITTSPPSFTHMAMTRAVSPAISQDGRHVAFASTDNPLGTNPDGNAEIFFFDTTLRQITNTTASDVSQRLREGNYQPSMTDDGRFVAFASNRNLVGLNADFNSEIFVYDALAQTFTQLTNTFGTIGATDAKISGDGSRIAYIRDNSSTGSAQRDLVLQERDGGSARVIAGGISNIAMSYGRAISDDGTRVVYAAEVNVNTSQVFLFDGRTGIVRQITSLSARVDDVPLHPTISGDGSRLAFATRRNVNGGNSDNSVELYAFDVPINQFTRLTNAPSTATAAVVSSLSDDGSIIAFNFPRVISGPVSSSDFANNSEIYTLALAARPPFATDLRVVNGASHGNEPSSTEAISPDSIAVATGSALAFTTEQSQRQPDGMFPHSFRGTTVTVNGRAAQIFYVSPRQVNFHVPAATEIGTAEVVVTNQEGFQTRGTISVSRAAPGLFTYSGDGRGEGVILDADTLQRGPFDPTNGRRRLTIFATGVRNISPITVEIGGRNVTVESIIASQSLPGLDEIHVLLPSDLRGAGTVELVVEAGGRESNAATLTLIGEARRDILINEILADPPDGPAGDANRDGTRSATQDEFVELVNATSRDLDISGYQILTRSASGADSVRHTFAPGTVFPAGTAIVVFGGAIVSSFNPNHPAFGGAMVLVSNNSLSLINSSGAVTIREPSGVFVNRVSYGGATGLSGDANQSLTRSPDITGGFALHQSVPEGVGRAFSPGTRINGTPFVASPAISRIEVTPDSATIFTGAQQQFTARAFDPSGQELSGVIFRWQSSATSIATINQNGLAQAGVIVGNTEIRASARGVQSAPSSLAVRQPQPVLTRIEVTPTSARIPSGAQQQFTARALDQFNRVMTGISFTWASSNTNVATINQSSLAIAVGPGTANITATSQTIVGSAAVNVFVPVVYINEVLADPPDGEAGDANRDGVRSGTDDEFIELVNSSSAVVNIADWTIRTRPLAGGTETVRHRFPTGITLPAHDALVVFGGGNPDINHPAFGGAQIFRASSAGGLSFSNAGLTIIVRDEEGNLIAQFSYGTPQDDFGGDSVNQSITRAPDLTGSFARHTEAVGAGGRRFSPGTKVDGSFFAPRVGRLSSVRLAPASQYVMPNETAQFTARALDQYERTMTNITITFTSSNPGVATVDVVAINPMTGVATATVAGRSFGSTEIRARATDGTISVTSTPAILNVNRAPRAGQVIINEALVSFSAGAGRADFVELYNTTNQTLDISGMVISFRAGGSISTASTVMLPGAVGSNTTLIQPHGYFIIVNGASTFGVTADFNAGTANFDLNNTTGAIKIEISGVKLDGLIYQGGATPPPSAFDDFGEGTIFTFTSGATNDLIRSPNATDTNNNAADFRRNGTVASVTPRAANPTIP